MLTEGAKRYKVVTQMGNQGASGDGTRLMKEWYDEKLIGDVHTVFLDPLHDVSEVREDRRYDIDAIRLV